jgi:hypothetical protein
MLELGIYINDRAGARLGLLSARETRPFREIG